MKLCELCELCGRKQHQHLSGGLPKPWFADIVMPVLKISSICLDPIDPQQGQAQVADLAQEAV